MNVRIVIALILSAIIVGICIYSYCYIVFMQPNSDLEQMELLNSRIALNENIHFSSHTQLLRNIFLRVEDKLVVDCYLNTKEHEWVAVSIDKLSDLMNVELNGTILFEFYGYDYTDQNGVDRRWEIFLNSSKSYISYDSPYFNSLPIDVKYPTDSQRYSLIEAIRANDDKYAVVYIEHLEGESGDTFMNKNEAIIEVQIADRYMKMKMEYLSLNSRSDGHGGPPSSASEIFLMENCIAIVVKGNQSDSIIVSDCIDTAVVEINDLLLRSNEAEHNRIQMTCDDGASLYIAYVEEVSSESVNSRNYIIMKNSMAGILDNQPWKDVLHIPFDRFNGTMEWFDDYIVYTEGREVYMFYMPAVR